MRRRILIVDDDRAACEAVGAHLQAVYDLRFLHDGFDVLEEARRFAPDLILLDINLPGPNGMSLLPRLHADLARTSVFMLTVRGEDETILRAFAMGAADYVTKPFSLAVLKARIERWFSHQRLPAQVMLGAVQVDLDAGMIRGKERQEELTRKEQLVFRCLWANAGWVVERQQLLDYAWGYDYEGTSRTVDNVVTAIRKKLAEAGETEDRIENVRGVGYRLRTEGS